MTAGIAAVLGREAKQETQQQEYNKGSENDCGVVAWIDSHNLFC